MKSIRFIYMFLILWMIFSCGKNNRTIVDKNTEDSISFEKEPEEPIVPYLKTFFERYKNQNVRLRIILNDSIVCTKLLDKLSPLYRKKLTSLENKKAIIQDSCGIIKILASDEDCGLESIISYTASTDVIKVNMFENGIKLAPDGEQDPEEQKKYVLKNRIYMSHIFKSYNNEINGPSQYVNFTKIYSCKFKGIYKSSDENYKYVLKADYDNVFFDDSHIYVYTNDDNFTASDYPMEMIFYAVFMKRTKIAELSDLFFDNPRPEYKYYFYDAQYLYSITK